MTSFYIIIGILIFACVMQYVVSPIYNFVKVKKKEGKDVSIRNRTYNMETRSE